MSFNSSFLFFYDTTRKIKRKRKRFVICVWLLKKYLEVNLPTCFFSSFLHDPLVSYKFFLGAIKSTVYEFCLKRKVNLQGYSCFLNDQMVQCT